MYNSESSYNAFCQLSVSTGNRLTSDYEGVCETEIGYSLLLTTMGFHWYSAQGAGRISFPNRTQPTSSCRISSRAHKQLALA